MHGPIPAKRSTAWRITSATKRTLSSKKPLKHGSLTPEKPKKRKQNTAIVDEVAWLKVPVYALRTAFPSQNLREWSHPSPQLLYRMT
jgi:hypothetical protein